MFILRKITESEGAEMNFDLGKSYTLITKEGQPKEFQKIAEHHEADVGIISAFVTTEDGMHCHYIYESQENYIMTESGKTFARV